MCQMNKNGLPIFQDREAVFMYVYVLRSIVRPDQIYVGLTSDITRRLWEHNEGLSLHTAKFRPWSLETTIWFADADKAIRFERYLKTGSGRAFRNSHF